MPIKDLPLTVTKAKVHRLYNEIPRRVLQEDINDIIIKNRSRKNLSEEEIFKLKKSQNLRHFEWLCILNIYKIPAGYSNNFIDGEQFEEKIKRYSDVKNFI